MRTSDHTLLGAELILWLLLSSPIICSADGPVKVTGQVIDKAYKPLENVRVQAERSSGEVSAVHTTGADGKYTVSLASGAPIEKITYTPVDATLHDAFVDLVSGKEEQHIDKVLNRITASLSSSEAVNALAAYEQVILAASEAKLGEDQRIRFEEIAKLKLIDRLRAIKVVSNELNTGWLNRRRSELLDLYAKLLPSKR